MADQQELMLLKLQEQHKQLEQMLKGHKEKMEKSSAKRRRHPPEPSQTPNNFQIPKTIAQPPFGHSNPSQGGSKHSNIGRRHVLKIKIELKTFNGQNTAIHIYVKWLYLGHSLHYHELSWGVP